eukprot:1524002-Pyramimonas_sp.AAC.1
MEIEYLKEIYCEVLCLDSGHSYAWKELYDGPGGDQVDGSPPAPVRVDHHPQSNRDFAGC